MIVYHTLLVSLYNSPNRPFPVKVDRYWSKLLAFNFKVVYEPGSNNPCDFTSRHAKHLPAELTEVVKERLGLED